MADKQLQTIFDSCCELEDRGLDIEVSMDQGVLNLESDGFGTWVINKQAPNQQLWWSSPLSGPMRFEYNCDKDLWCATKTEVTINGILASEFMETLGVEVDVR